MWLSVSGILVLFLYVNTTVARDVSADEMIKDAILKLARIIRDDGQRTQRHQARERYQSDAIKKAVEDLTAKVSIVDTFVTYFSKIEGQISDVEQLLTQRDERERIQMQKTADSIQNLETHLGTQLEEIRNQISEASQRVEPTVETVVSSAASDIISKLNDTEAHFFEKVEQIRSSLDTMAIDNNKTAAAQAEAQRTACSERNEDEENRNARFENLIVNMESRLKIRLDEIKNTVNESNVSPIQPTETAESVLMTNIMAKLNDTELHFLEKFVQIQSELDTMAVKNAEEATAQAEKLQTVFSEVRNISVKLRDVESSLTDVYETAKKGEEEPKIDIGEIIGVQNKEIGKITDLVESTLNRIQDLPMTSEIQAMHNETQKALQESKYALNTSVSNELNRVISSIGDKNREVNQSIEELRLALADNSEFVNKKLNDLAKNQEIMGEIEDDVIDTKKKLELVVHQIEYKVSKLMNEHGATINQTLNDRFDEVSNEIINNQSSSLTNLTMKMDQDLKQVWRQIIIMHQQMTDNAKALSKLNEQNEAYVNSTTSIMDGMDNKVGKMKIRMSEVDANLNYLLGSLALTTNQFNEIRSGLGIVLDEIRVSFEEVQEKAKDLSHSGPHPIPHSYGQRQELPKN